MSDDDDRLAAIAEHLRAHPADRHPLEHAVGQFHLGVALADAGRLAEARRALEVAASLFAGAERPVEEAKARNGLGAVLRLLGEREAATAAFTAAADAFEAAALPAEQGAALFNLGLARREADDPQAARDVLAQARSLLEGEAPPAQGAAAARELGATLLVLGEPDEAAVVLAEAVEVADRVGDRAGAGGASNVLGLAHLAAGRPADAVDALRGAVGRHHRSLHAEGHAMALANLALAYERSGDELRARTAARHALGIGAAAAPVREQAGALVERLAPQPGDPVALLREEPRDRWLAVVRAELAWWLDAPPDTRREAVAGWVAADAADDDLGPELTHALFEAVLELSPAQMEQVLRALVEATGTAAPESAEGFRAHVARALPRFHVPQWQRLEQALDRLASEAGQEPWSTS